MLRKQGRVGEMIVLSRRGFLAAGVIVMIGSMVISPRAEAATMSGSIVLTSDTGVIVLNSPDGNGTTTGITGVGGTWSWAGKTAGLDMGGYNITRNTDPGSITLDLYNGAIYGSITNGGLISTSRDGVPGSIVVTNVSSVALNGISTVCTSDGGSFAVGSVILTGQDGGNLSIGASGIQTYYNRSGTAGLGGVVSLQRFNRVTISGSIGTWAAWSLGGAVSIGTPAKPIGGPISVARDIATFTGSDYTAKGAPISLFANGPISVGNLTSSICREYLDSQSGASDITVVNKGAFTCGSITNGVDRAAPVTTVSINGTDSSGTFVSGAIDAHRTCYMGGHGSQVAIGNFGSVTINGDVRADVSACYQGPWNGGNFSVSNIPGNITITGSINLSGKAESGWGTPTHGVLSLASTDSKSVITLADLDLSKVSYAVLSPGSKCILKGVLAGFSTGNPNQTQLRLPAGKRIYYYPELAGNAYLLRAKYVLASPDGTPAAGGVLMPYVSPGTVITVK
ncbi:MAG: hypothetical protein C0404_02450 [Verrucomicrobia bacterium]|nr:hypothetical protein [Verrucomicrobiota bacterium]